MGRDEELFFHFLRLGLWGEEPDEPGYDMTGLTRDDWCRIYDMGHRQAVSGIVTDGIAHCGVRPDGELWGQWIAQLIYMERMNSRIANERALSSFASMITPRPR